MNASNGRLLIGFLLGLFAGGSATYFGMGGMSAPGEVRGAISPAGIEPGRVTTLPPAAPAELPAAPDEGPSRAVAEAETNRVEVPDSRVAELLAAVDTPQVSRSAGSGEIHGRVVDGEDAGLEEVLLRATRRARSSSGQSPSAVGSGPPELEELDEVVRAAVERYSESRSNTFEVRTGGDGAYRFENLPEGPWRIEAFKQDFVLEAQGSASQVTLGTELDFLAEPVIIVPVQVFSPSGRPSSSAILSCEPSGQSRPTTYRWTSAEAFLRLAPGSYEVTALSDDGRRGASSNDPSDQTSEPQSVELEAGVAPPTLRFELKGRLGIRGTLRMPNDGITGLSPRVARMALAPDQEIDLELLVDSGESTWAQSGREFSFLDLEPGRYLIGASRNWRAPIVVHEVVEVVDGIVRCDLELPPLDPAEFLRAVVLGPGGRSIKGVEFQFSHQRGGGSSSSSLDPGQTREGVYLIGIPHESRASYFEEPTEQDEFQLVASHEKHGSKTVDLVPGQAEVTITLATPAELEVTILGYQGSGFEGRLEVDANPVESGSRSYHYGGGDSGVNSAGVRKFDGLEPGRYRLSLRLGATRSRRNWSFGHEVASQEVELVPGPNVAQLAIPTLYTFKVHWADAKAGTSIGLSSLSGDGQRWNLPQAEFDDGGVALFENVPAGDYALQAWGGGTRRMELRVPCGDVVFEPMKIDALRIVITQESGDLFRLGFRTGDLVIGVDGKEFEGEPDFSVYGELMGSKTAETTFLVQRGAKRLELAVKGNDLGDWQSMGGNFEPTGR